MMDREESADKEQNQRAGGLFSGLRIVSLCTLVSRVLGFIRELAIAGLWGLSPVSDAFIGAFRIPNLAGIVRRGSVERGIHAAVCARARTTWSKRGYAISQFGFCVAGTSADGAGRCC